MKDMEVVSKTKYGPNTMTISVYLYCHFLIRNAHDTASGQLAVYENLWENKNLTFHNGDILSISMYRKQKSSEFNELWCKDQVEKDLKPKERKPLIE